VSLRSFCEWLGNTPGSVAIHESVWAYPIIESVHVLFLCLFAGVILMWDLRLMGLVLRRTPVSEMSARVLPWAVAGFIVMLISGSLLVYQEPLRAYDNPFFRAKAVMLILAGVNVLVFHRTIGRGIPKWNVDPVPPARARLAGGVSLSLWAMIIVCGRLIAYNWFSGAH
jgi:hypothetical protein